MKPIFVEISGVRPVSKGEMYIRVNFATGTAAVCQWQEEEPSSGPALVVKSVGFRRKPFTKRLRKALKLTWIWIKAEFKLTTKAAATWHLLPDYSLPRREQVREYEQRLLNHPVLHMEAKRVQELKEAAKEAVAELLDPASAAGI